MTASTHLTTVQQEGYVSFPLTELAYKIYQQELGPLRRVLTQHGVRQLRGRDLTCCNGEATDAVADAVTRENG